MKIRFEVLDIFRGLFSLLVVLYHMSAFSNSLVIKNNFITNSDLFVDFFFVLSGFVISFSYSTISNYNQFKNFLKKRIYRLYPLHLIVLLIFVTIEFSKHFFSSYFHINKLVNESNSFTTFLTSLFLVNSVKMPNVNDVSWNIASWSISAEIISYSCFGVLLVFISAFKFQKYKTTIFTLIITLAIFVLFIATKTFELTFTYDYGFIRGILGFFTGALCLNVYNITKEHLFNVGKHWFTFAEVTVFILIIAMIWNGNYFKPIGVVYELLFFTAVLVFSFEQGFLSKQLKKYGLLHKLGKYSYSIYMTHTLLLSLFNIVFIRILKLPSNAYSYLFIFNLILIYIVSSFSYKFIEMRFSDDKKAKKTKNLAW